MRLPRIVTFIFLTLFCACNSFTSDKGTTQPKPKQDFNDVEFQKLRKQQDSLLELKQKKSKKKGLDSLKPIQA